MRDPERIPITIGLIILIIFIFGYAALGYKVTHPDAQQYTVTFMTECDSVIHNYTFTKRYIAPPVARTKVEYINVDSSAWKLYTLYFAGTEVDNKDETEFAIYSSCGPIKIIDFRLAIPDTITDKYMNNEFY